MNVFEYKCLRCLNLLLKSLMFKLDNEDIIFLKVCMRICGLAGLYGVLYCRTPDLLPVYL